MIPNSILRKNKKRNFCYLVATRNLNDKTQFSIEPNYIKQICDMRTIIMVRIIKNQISHYLF